MSRATSIINKVNGALNRTKGFNRTISLRVVTMEGGDPLLKRGGTPVSNDRVLNPQPFADRMGRQRIAGGHVDEETLISPSGQVLMADDYEILVSPTAASLDDFQDPNAQIVFTDSSGREEILKLLDYETATIDGTDVVYTLYARSVKRP